VYYFSFFIFCVFKWYYFIEIVKFVSLKKIPALMKRIHEEPLCHECGNVVHTIFTKLLPDEIEYINQRKRCARYEKGVIMYDEGSRTNGFYCICKGTIKVYKTGVEGKEQIIRFAKKGDIIGYRSIIAGEAACTSAKVLDDAVICFIYTSDLYYLLKKNAEFGIELLQLACTELGEANNYITDIAQKSVRERLAEVLVNLKDNFGLDDDNVLQIYLTREELANLIGTATESVIRLLSEFKQDKLIELQGRKIRIVDETRLTRIANML
jgi:CRP/FNR family transcriptional regulator, polysaccharide utilization system transcription regulator